MDTQPVGPMDGVDTLAAQPWGYCQQECNTVLTRAVWCEMYKHILPLTHIQRLHWLLLQAVLPMWL